MEILRYKKLLDNVHVFLDLSVKLNIRLVLV